MCQGPKAPTDVPRLHLFTSAFRSADVEDITVLNTVLSALGKADEWEKALWTLGQRVEGGSFLWCFYFSLGCLGTFSRVFVFSLRCCDEDIRIEHHSNKKKEKKKNSNSRVGCYFDRFLPPPLEIRGF